MSNFDVQSILHSAEYRQELAAQRTFMARVYGWMSIGLLVTALVALALWRMADLQKSIFSNTPAVLILCFGSMVLGYGLQFAIHRIPVALSAVLYIIYAAMMGIMFSTLFLVYTKASVASTFFITAGMFGGMSAFGYMTKRDLSGIGSMLIMAMWGLFIASIINIFLGSSGLYWIMTYAGVIVFTGLAAYYTQSIKQSYASGEYGSSAFERSALVGAFFLYLIFIDLFILMLRILGKARE